MNEILKYFPHLSDAQIEQFTQLEPLYREWNEKINVISRKDIDNLYVHHVLHSLSIAKALRFKNGTKILDLGTGGGFPGIPLAIMFPDCQFKLIDGTGKKILVTNEVAKALKLKNVHAVQIRGEQEKEKFDFIVSRAVMPLPDLFKLVRKNISPKHKNAMPNGIMCLKGGNVEGEILHFKKSAEVMDISLWFEEEWFKEKHLIYLPI